MTVNADLEVETSNIVADAARSVVWVEFRWDGLGSDPATVVDAMCSRRVRVPKRTQDGVVGVESHSMAVWQPAHNVPNGVGELSKAIRALMDFTPESRSSFTWRRLRLSNALLDALFQTPTIGKKKPRKSNDRLGGFVVEAVDAYLLPLGHGLVVFTIDWCLGTPRPVDEVLQGLSYMRHVREQGGLSTWTLGASRVLLSEPATGMNILCDAVRESQPIDLANIVRGLLAENDAQEDPVSESRLGVVHSLIRLSSEPPSPQLEGLLFRLRRGYGPDYEAPSAVVSDRVYAPRGNRWIGVAREGAACVTWTTSTSNQGFETEWPKRFEGVYLFLHILGHAERLVLTSLSARISTLAFDLDPHRLRYQQSEIEALVVELARYTLTLTSEDCGGPSDYSDFFSAVRRVHNISAQRDELRAEMAELNGLLKAAEDQTERRLQRFLSLAAGVTLPLALVFGFFGMNAGSGEQATFEWGLIAWVGAGALALGLGAAAFVTRDVRSTPQGMTRPKTRSLANARSGSSTERRD